MSSSKKARYNPHFIDYMKDPFDEEDVARLYKSKQSPKCLMEISMVWGMQRCAQMLQASGVKGAVKKFEELLNKELIAEEDIPGINEVEEEDDLEGML